MTSHIKIKLELNSSNMIEVLEAHQGDKNSRFIDVMLTSDGEILQISDGITAKYDATIDNIVVANDLSATVDAAENIITVELTENMLSISGLLKIDLKILESDALITAQTLRVKVGKSVINNDSKFEPTGGTIKQFMDEVAVARGDFDNLNARFDSKADKATTLAGYGITDGENIGNKVSDTTKITDENANYPSIKYLNDLLSQKYDSSNIETGIGSLTPSSNSKDVIQSADFKYQRIGNKVTIEISITFIAGEYREIELIKLPFVCQNEYLRGICVTNTNREFIWGIYDVWLTSSSYLRISRTDSYNFSNNENLNFTFSYFIDT